MLPLPRLILVKIIIILDIILLFLINVTQENFSSDQPTEIKIKFGEKVPAGVNG